MEYVEYRNEEHPPLEKLPACPVETTASLIGSKWRLLILRDLLANPMRFGELKKSVGSISQKVLTSNLREMEDCGLVVRMSSTPSPIWASACAPSSTPCGSGAKDTRRWPNDRRTSRVYCAALLRGNHVFHGDSLVGVLGTTL